MISRRQGLVAGLAVTWLLWAAPGRAAAADSRLPYGPTVSESPSTGVTILAEAGGAVVGGAITGAGLGVMLLLVRVPFSGDYSGIANLGLGAVVGYAAGCPLGTCGAGALLGQTGRFLPALLGSTAGMAAAVGVALLGADDAFLVSAAVLPPAGAVIGYNLSRPKTADEGSFLDRFELPVSSIERARGDEGNVCMAVSIRLATVRF